MCSCEGLCKVCIKKCKEIDAGDFFGSGAPPRKLTVADDCTRLPTNGDSWTNIDTNDVYNFFNGTWTLLGSLSATGAATGAGEITPFIFDPETATTSTRIIPRNSVGNSVSTNSSNSSILSGENNSITSLSTSIIDRTAIITGSGNILKTNYTGDYLTNSFIGGGTGNFIEVINIVGNSNIYNSHILGGEQNKIRAYRYSISDSSIINGFNNTIRTLTTSNADINNALILTGNLNRIESNSGNGSTGLNSIMIGGGSNNLIRSSGNSTIYYSNILNGHNNTISTSNDGSIYRSFILNGTSNTIKNDGTGNLNNIAILGGENNRILSNSSSNYTVYCFIISGINNSISNVSSSSYNAHSSILNGDSNRFIAYGGGDILFSSIGNGVRNIIRCGTNSRVFHSNILNGSDNIIQAIGSVNNMLGSNILGGNLNTIRAMGSAGNIRNNVIITGNRNFISQNGFYNPNPTDELTNSVISSGSNNKIKTSYSSINNCQIVAGDNNEIYASSNYNKITNSVIIGGQSNTIYAKGTTTTLRPKIYNCLVSSSTGCSIITSYSGKILSNSILSSQQSTIYAYNTGDISQSGILFGTNNTIINSGGNDLLKSAILGGENNILDLIDGTIENCIISNGNNNKIRAIVDADIKNNGIFVGQNNTLVSVKATFYNNFIGGGMNNIISTTGATNIINNSFIGNGTGNTISTYDSNIYNSLILTGSLNTIFSDDNALIDKSGILMGMNNQLSATGSNSEINSSVIVSGTENAILAANGGTALNSAILTGKDNTISAGSHVYSSHIGSGEFNIIAPSGSNAYVRASIIDGGNMNAFRTDETCAIINSVISGGINNTISSERTLGIGNSYDVIVSSCAIIGGSENTMRLYNAYGSPSNFISNGIFVGTQNKIFSESTFYGPFEDVANCAIIGGILNTIRSSKETYNCIILGGVSNIIGNATGSYNSAYDCLIGASKNCLINYSNNCFILGGSNNTISNGPVSYSLIGASTTCNITSGYTRVAIMCSYGSTAAYNNTLYARNMRIMGGVVTSDENMKKDILQLSSMTGPTGHDFVECIKMLEPISFKWKDLPPGDMPDRLYGFSAQNCQTAAAWLVEDKKTKFIPLIKENNKYYHSGPSHNEYDNQVYDIFNNKNYTGANTGTHSHYTFKMVEATNKSIKPVALQALTIAAMKKMIERIETLEAQVATLQSYHA